METTDFEFTFKDLKITWQDMLNISPEESRGMNEFRDQVDEVFEAAKSQISTKGGFRVINRVSWMANGIRLEDTTLTTQAIIATNFKLAEAVAVFACTAGPAIKSMYTNYQSENEPVKAFIVDTLGTVVVEKAMNAIQAKLAEAVKQKGWKITNRYSPGYCGWYVGEQQKLWSFLPNNYCGISLTESSLMTPVKSVSGIIGLGTAVKQKAYACTKCSVNQCIYKNQHTK